MIKFRINKSWYLAPVVDIEHCLCGCTKDTVPGVNSVYMYGDWIFFGELQKKENGFVQAKLVKILDADNVEHELNSVTVELMEDAVEIL